MAVGHDPHAPEAIDYAMVIYEEHLRPRGGPGDLVTTRTHPWLMERFPHLDGKAAWNIRREAHARLKAEGYVERVNKRGEVVPRGPYFRILK